MYVAVDASRRVRSAVYILDLCDEVLGSRSSREHRFDWLLGDPGKTGRRVRLPVDAYWADLRLVVEVYERQHDESVAHFDKPDRLTVSGVHRGRQRQIYDQRRLVEVPAHGLQLVILRTRDLTCTPGGRLLRNRDADLPVIRQVLAGATAGPR